MTMTLEVQTENVDLPDDLELPEEQDEKGQVKFLQRPFQIKEFDEEEGTFDGYASVFDVEDSYHDIVVKGAFKRTLSHWKQRKMPVPILWQHMPWEPIGATLEAEEDDHGLRIKGRLVLGVRRADEARLLMKNKVLGGLSIGYSVVKAAWDKENNVNRLLELRLWEWSPVTWPANEMAAYGNVKSDDLNLMLKVDRRIGGIEEALRELRDTFAASSAAEPVTPDEGSGDHPTSEEEMAQLAEFVRKLKE